MPELPEIEILKDEVNAQMVGKEVEWATARTTDKGRLHGEERLSSLRGSRVVGASRRGKNLIIEFDNGLCLVIHLMLIGQVRLLRGQRPDPARSAVALHFSDGDSFALAGVGAGLQHLVPKGEVETLPSIAELGPDALSPELTPQRLGEMLAGRRRAIKPLLMEGSFVAGLGNTYTDEALFTARIHPQREAGSLSQDEVAALHTAIRATLEKGRALGGYSGEQFVLLDGNPGRFQEETLVHLREGEPCYECGATIEKTRVSSRVTYLCPNCQRL